jgi:hypothetical protein
MSLSSASVSVLDLLGGIFILLISMNLCAEPPESVLSAHEDRRATKGLVMRFGNFFDYFFLRRANFEEISGAGKLRVN